MRKLIHRLSIGAMPLVLILNLLLIFAKPTAAIASTDPNDPPAQCYLVTSGNGLKSDGDCKDSGNYSVQMNQPPGGDFSDDRGSCFIVNTDTKNFDDVKCDDAHTRSLVWNAPGITSTSQMASINWASRITYRAPTIIKDDTTGVSYRTSSEIFGNATSSYLNDGDGEDAKYFYAPLDTDGKTSIVQKDGKCLGGFMLRLGENGQDAILYAVQPEPTSGGGSCAVGTAASGLIEFKEGRVHDIKDQDWISFYTVGSWGGADFNDSGTSGLGGNSNNTALSDESRFGDVMAALAWGGRDIITAFDVKSDFQPFKLLTDGVSYDNIKAEWETQDIPRSPSREARSAGSWKFFQTSCNTDIYLAIGSDNRVAYGVMHKNGKAQVVSMDASWDNQRDSDDGPFEKCIWGRDVDGMNGGAFEFDANKTRVAFAENANKDAADVDTNDFNNTGSTLDPNASVDSSPKCSDAGGLSWILCLILDGMDNVRDYAENQISSFLFVNPDMFNSSNPDNPGGKNSIYVAWSTFRSLATIIIVIIALIMIFSEAMGQGVFDNYSVKKLLPRLLLAGIAIQLSWFLMTQLVNVFNILGNGIGNILLNPFHIDPAWGMKELIAEKGYISAEQGTVLGLMAVGAGIALVFSAVGLGIMIVAALAVALATLVIRNLLIYLGVVFAPIALALSILPGTQKASKFWWESFEKALMMYPLVVALFAAGKIMASLLLLPGNASDGIQSINVVAAIIAWYAPLFLFPKALQRGGQIMGKVAGFANDKSKGVFDKTKDWRKNRKEFRKKVSEQDRFNRAGGTGIRAGLARATIRNKQGQNITGLSLRSSRKQAMDRSMQSLREQSIENSTKEAEKQLQNGSNLSRTAVAYRNAGADANALVAEIRSSTDSSQRQAMINRLVTLKKDKEVRDLLGNAGNAEEELARAINNGSIATSFGDKAPDIPKAIYNGRGQGFSQGDIGLATAPKTHAWSEDTWRIALQAPGAPVHYKEMLESNPDAVDNLDPKKKLVIQAVTGPINYAEQSKGNSPPPPPSDLRLKRSVSYIGNIHNFRLYKYQYIWSDTFYVGVMAQDLLETHPEALTIDKYGYYHVDYLRLGIKLQTYEEWLENQKHGAEVAEVAQS